MQAQACPVCQGRGTVPPNFYSRIPFMSSDQMPERCRSCDGRGVVFAPNGGFELPNLRPVRRHVGPARMDTDGTITGDGEVSVS